MPLWKPKPKLQQPLTGEGISLLVPFKANKDDHRVRVWDWLRKHWSYELPGAEVVIGHSDSTPFCKTAAVNEAARNAHGDIFIIMDADCYISTNVILQNAAKMRDSEWPLWFIPYRRFFRLTEEYTLQIIASDPQHPLIPPNPPDASIVESRERSMFGHWFGALIQMMPREAFELVGGMDERFLGWGGEDVSFARAVDTLYGRHKTSNNPVYHLWHDKIGATYETRLWFNQPNPMANNALSLKYDRAWGDPEKMRALVDGGHPAKVFPYMYT